MDNNKMITVFTPTYNRAHLLPNLYNSLLKQDKTLFEWIIVDDGSTDNTEELIRQFVGENKIEIKYIKQVNKGKHFAINRGVAEARGDLFWIVDSDDELPEKALQTVIEKYNRIKDNPAVGGVAGRRNFHDHKIVGSEFEGDILSNSLDIRFKHKITGDLVEVFRTEVLREFPFPEIEGEKFCPEALVWNRIAQKYQLLFFNKGIYTTQYLPDGLTAKIVKIRMTSPVASMVCYSEQASYKIPLKEKIKANINFWRFSFNSKKPFFEKLKMVNPFPSILGLPLGFAMYLNDRKHLKK